MDKRLNGGFTLLELIVVLGIVAVLSGGALLNFALISKKETLASALAETKKLFILSQRALQQGQCSKMELSLEFTDQKIRARCTEPVNARREMGELDFRNRVVSLRGEDKKGNRELNKTTFVLVNKGLGRLSLERVISFPDLTFEDGDFALGLVFSLGGETKELVLKKHNLLYGFEF